MHHDDKIDNSIKKKPDIISYYNKNKGGVDIIDQLCNSYCCGRGTRRWPMAIFYRIIDMIGINAFVLYKENNHLANFKRRDFLKELGMKLCLDHLKARFECKNQHKTIKILISKFLKIPYQGNFIQPGPCQIRKKNIRCDFCERKEDRKTNIQCQSCSKFICDIHRNIFCTNCYLLNDQDEILF